LIHFYKRSLSSLLLCPVPVSCLWLVESANSLVMAAAELCK